MCCFVIILPASTSILGGKIVGLRKFIILNNEIIEGLKYSSPPLLNFVSIKLLGLFMPKEYSLSAQSLLFTGVNYFKSSPVRKKVGLGLSC